MEGTEAGIVFARFPQLYILGNNIEYVDPLEEFIKSSSHANSTIVIPLFFSSLCSALI